MRENKFRGKRIDTKEWVYGNLIYSSDACKEYETLIIPQKNADGFITDYASNGENKESYGFDNWFCVIPETVGRFTGLKDGTKWEQLTEQERLNFYNKNESEDGATIKYQNINDVKHLWKGKEIYEGDIVKAKGFYFESRGEEIGVINHTKFSIFLQNFSGYSDEYLVHYNELEVIGNIYENPELLKSN